MKETGWQQSGMRGSLERLDYGKKLLTILTIYSTCLMWERPWFDHQHYKNKKKINKQKSSKHMTNLPERGREKGTDLYNYGQCCFGTLRKKAKRTIHNPVN